MVSPDKFPQQLQQARSFSDEGQPGKAAQIYTSILNQQPDHYEANYSLGMLCHEGGRTDLAIPLIKKSVEIRPEVFAGLINLGMMLRDEGHLEDSRLSLQRAIELEPDSAISHITLGLLLIDLGELDLALEAMETGLRLEPDNPQTHARMGMLQQVRGENEAAARHYRKVIEKMPLDGTAHRSLAFLQKHTEHTEDIGKTEFAFKSADTSDKDRMLLGNALGKIYDDLGQYDRAIGYLHAANRHQRRMYDYSIEKQKSFFERHKKELGEEFLEHCKTHALSDNTPIFVVGMPRSGTSLVEQILASHPLAYGAGEVEYSRLIVDAVQSHTQKPFPLDVSTVPGTLLNQAGQAYIAKLRANAETAERVVDKLPHNFLRVGLFAGLMPNAKIVLCERDPMDNCLSIYQHLFGPAHAYASDLSDLGKYYRLYQDLVAWWEELLPGHMYHVRYESLVGDTENQVRQLLDYCEVPFHEACLAFHKTRRQVKTPSASQVQQPIYKGSKGRWKNYENHLEPLRTALQIK